MFLSPFGERKYYLKISLNWCTFRISFRSWSQQVMALLVIKKVWITRLIIRLGWNHMEWLKRTIEPLPVICHFLFSKINLIYFSCHAKVSNMKLLVNQYNIWLLQSSNMLSLGENWNSLWSWCLATHPFLMEINWFFSNVNNLNNRL